MENLRYYKYTSFISSSYNQLENMKRFNKKKLHSLGSSFQYEKSSDRSTWENQSESDNSIILCNNDFSYRNEKKYYQLLEKHRIRQDKIKRLSTRTSCNLLNNEFGIKNKTDTSDRLPKITKTSYQVLSGFCQRNCPLQSAKEIININFSDDYERELRRKNRSQNINRNRLKKTISLPLPKSKNINENINKEIKGIYYNYIH